MIYRSYRDKLQKDYRMASELYRKNRLLESLEYYEAVADVDPDYGGAGARVEDLKHRLNYMRESYYNTALNQQRAGQALNALMSYRRCVNLSPNGAHRDAKSRISELLDHPEVKAALKGYLDRATAYRKAGKYQQARGQYEAALLIDPGLGEARSGLSDVDDHLLASARPRYEEGQKLFQAGNYAAAVQKYQQAISIFPDYTEASDALDRARTLARNDQNYQLALAAANSGNPPGCLSYISQISGYHPQAGALKNRCTEDLKSNVDRYFQQAVSLYQQQKLEESRALFRWILVVRPDHEEAAKYVELVEKKIETLRQIEE